MKPLKFQRLFLLVVLVPTVSSLIISSVYAGKKKFKTFSFGTPLLPAIVKVEPNKFHLTFRQYKYLRTPQFKIEGTLPLKAPTIIKEVFKPDPNPEVTEFNIGDMSAIPEADQYLAYDDTKNYPSYAEAPAINGPPIPLPSVLPAQPLLQSPSDWKPIQSPIEFTRGFERNSFPTHHRIRRFANEYNHQFNPSQRNQYFNNNGNFGHNFEIPQNLPNFNNYPVMAHNSQPFNGPPIHQNYYNPNNAHYSGDQSMENIGFSNPYHNSHPSQHSYDDNSHLYPSYQPNPDMTASPSSFAPPKYEKVFAPSNHQNNRWIPIDTSNPSNPSAPLVPHNPTGDQTTNFQNFENTAEPSNKKLNIGEHYNPSASYVDETIASKPTYDPESDPDEGSVSFSISGPHGGPEVPAGYESKIKEMHEQLKEHPHHIPPGMDIHQVMKYYNQHTFTDPLKNSYGYKPAFGPLGFLKSKLMSWKKLI